MNYKNYKLQGGSQSSYLKHCTVGFVNYPIYINLLCSALTIIPGIHGLLSDSLQLFCYLRIIMS